MCAFYHDLHGVLLLVYVAAIFTITYFVENRMPPALKIEDEVNHSDRFIAERAQNYLKGLTDMGPRVVGSYQNEVLAVNYIRKAINDTIAEKNNAQSIEYDISTVSGSYYLAYKPYGSINAYANLQNVVVKVNGANNSENSILINSHFDTVVGSPGGSDDGINCAVMLEVLRKISQSPKKPTNNLIFLFNGGEESNIQASHGFITQHRWAKDIKIVINLEATGAGGKEILFQAGPDQAWLMKYYSKVPHPFANVAGEEIFKSNIIPSDSDFRIFRDFGGVIGYDFAYIKDGYRYHTRYDGFDNIEIGRYQRNGDNILKLVQELAHAPEVANPKIDEGGTVFFDFLGLFLVYYDEKLEIIVNVIVIAASFVLFIWSLHDLQIGFSRKGAIYVIIQSCSILLGWISSFIAMALTALFLGVINKTMSWYGIPVLAIGLYSTTTIIFSHTVVSLFDKFVVTNTIPLTPKVLIHIHLIRTIWTFVMLVGFVIGIKSVYLFMVPILFNTVFMFTIQMFQLHNNAYHWIFIYLFGEITPTLFSSAVAYHILSLFIPICGRFGSSLNPEFMIGAFTVALTILIICYYMPLFLLLSKQSYPLILLGAFFLASIIIAMTPVGFPYAINENGVTPQRFPIFHTRRIYHDETGKILNNDSGFYFRNMDYNSPRSIKDYILDVANISSLYEECQKALFCGLPVTYSRDFEELEYNSWIPSVDPFFNEELPILTLTSTEWISNNIRRYYFTATGPGYIDLYLSPKEGVTFSNISLNAFIPNEQPLWNSRPTIYILYVNGKEISPLNFYVDFTVPAGWNGSLVDIAIIGKYIHEKDNVLTEEFQSFLEKFPNWTVFTTIALAHYESWVY